MHEKCMLCGSTRDPLRLSSDLAKAGLASACPMSLPPNESDFRSLVASLSPVTRNPRRSYKCRARGVHLEDPEIDAVYIPLPNSMHREWTVRAAEAGKHVLCEKPLGLDTAEALEMADACRAHGVQLMDGVMWVHHPRADQMKRVLDDGSLGRVRRATSAFTFCFDEIPEYDIRLDPRMGGGSLGDLGWYCCRAALWAFGTLPQRVFATARYFRGVDMNLTAVLWYDDTVRGSEINW